MSPSHHGIPALAISRSAFEQLLGQTKVILRPMSWTRGLGSPSPAFFQYDSSIALDTETLVAVEGMRVVCRYRPSINGKPEVLALSLLIENDRVYALDYGKWYRHVNNKGGRGRPMWGERFRGSQQHFWSDDGYGYAEPLADPANPEDAWRQFLTLGNFEANFPFVHPLSGGDKDQRVLIP